MNMVYNFISISAVTILIIYQNCLIISPFTQFIFLLFLLSFILQDVCPVYQTFFSAQPHRLPSYFEFTFHWYGNSSCRFCEQQIPRNNMTLSYILSQAANGHLDLSSFSSLASPSSLSVLFSHRKHLRFCNSEHYQFALLSSSLRLQVLSLLQRKYFNYFLMHFTYSECSLNCVSVVQIWTEFVRFALHHELKIWIRVSKSGFRNLCASIWVTEPGSAALVWINHLNYSIIRP